MKEIELMDENKLIGFNKPDITREIRAIKIKINEIIEVINAMNEPPYTDDLDDEEDDDEMSDDERNIITPGVLSKLGKKLK